MSLKASKRFIQYLSDHSLDWAMGGQVPVRKNLRASEHYLHFMDALTLKFRPADSVCRLYA